MAVAAAGASRANTCRPCHAGGTSGHVRGSADTAHHVARRLCPSAGLVQGVPPPGGRGPARPGGRRPRGDVPLRELRSASKSRRRLVISCSTVVRAGRAVALRVPDDARRRAVQDRDVGQHLAGRRLPPPHRTMSVRTLRIVKARPPPCAGVKVAQPPAARAGDAVGVVAA